MAYARGHYNRQRGLAANWHHHHAYGGGDYFGQQHGLGQFVAAAKEAPGVIEFVKGFIGGIFGGRVRAGGLDPCCPDPHPTGFKAGSEPRAWPRNSRADGRIPGGVPGHPTPPDFRLLSPIDRKDDACDCIPVIESGRGWVIGTIALTGLPNVVSPITGRVTAVLDFVPASAMPDPQNANWIDVATLRTATVTAAISPEAPAERIPTFPIEPGAPGAPGVPVVPFQVAGIAGGPMVIAAVGIALGLMLLGGKRRRRR